MTKRKNASRAELLRRNAMLERSITPGSVVVYFKRRGLRRLLGRTEQKMFPNSIAELVPAPAGTLVKIHHQDAKGTVVYTLDWSNIERVATVTSTSSES